MTDAGGVLSKAFLSMIVAAVSNMSVGSALPSTLCREDGYVVAVVRGSSDKAAYSRLRAGYDTGDPELLQVFDDLARKHLRVYAGEQQPLSATWHEWHHRHCLMMRHYRGQHASV